MPLLLGCSFKTYFSHARTLEWLRAVAETARQHPAVSDGRVELFALPQFPSIPEALETVAGSAGGGLVAIGAQDLAEHDEGAYTGEVSGAVLAELGCTLVEVGHAERRRLYGETEEVVAAKTTAALRNGLTPVLCVGEEDRMEADRAAEVVAAQIASALAPAREAGLTGQLVVAYEPVWAIGAAEPASAEHVVVVTGALRPRLRADTDLPGRIIYGGSAGPGLLPRIAAGVDGMFLGRFAHDPAAVTAILDEVLDLDPGTGLDGTDADAGRPGDGDAPPARAPR
ncbi:triosephosphate isomerase [Desertihabitans brevis]|uniref:Triosephosphate isomerase n=1 Tax=Desertihabitans brevis TaxID=2268447 RepID=A0A367YX89_9ACTN|nr:triose-phosphate isomerase family protein [Desertihabitans brevis]RCK70440.1 triosephosphate isomerase [Desertihabitans brevis]